LPELIAAETFPGSLGSKHLKLVAPEAQDHTVTNRVRAPASILRTDFLQGTKDITGPKAFDHFCLRAGAQLATATQKEVCRLGKLLAVADAGTFGIVANLGMGG
jgi:hypothetical protein